MQTSKLVFIFDLDGVILDSEPLHDYAKKRILEDYQISSDEDLSWSVGKPNQELWSKLIEQHHIPANASQLELKQYQYILQQISERNIPVSEGLPELLNWLTQQAIPKGIASSSDRYYINKIIEYYQLTNHFNFTIAGDEVQLKKPAPDIYLKATKLAGISCQQAIALEDSTSGIKAAKTAGLACIAYKNPTSGNQDLRQADYQVDSLNAIIPIMETMLKQ